MDNVTERTGESPILEVKNVHKRFGAVQALADVSLEVRPNEIVGVVGENGAGKTTLMKVLVGVHAPDDGEWFSHGERVPFPAHPKEAAQRGLSIVYQEKGVIPSLRIYQFLFLGHEERYIGPWGLLTDRMKAHAREILDEFEIRCDVGKFMYELPLAVQKMVEIAKAILNIRLEQGEHRTESVIILDEPTAPLTIEQRKELLHDIAGMKQNCSFVFVTHIMQEVMECMDRVYVLRDGRLVRQYDMAAESVSEEDLTRVIIGKEPLPSGRTGEPGTEPADRETVLSLSGLTRKGSFYDVSFELHRGECLGILGPAGSGKSELVRSVAGILGFDSGVLSVNGRAARPREPVHVRLSRGIGYFSGDTDRELLHDWPIRKNISLLNTSRIVGGPLRTIRFSAERTMAQAIMQKLRIKAPGVNTVIATLSGGSKQKVTVGKWFERGPAILLVEDPTKGIDVGSRADIYETTLEMKARGISMILVSDDAKEYLALCDRIVVMRQGRTTEIISRAKFKEVVER